MPQGDARAAGMADVAMMDESSRLECPARTRVDAGDGHSRGAETKMGRLRYYCPLATARCRCRRHRPTQNELPASELGRLEGWVGESPDDG
jgi:hypothetical protein